MIQLTRQDKDGELSACIINTKYITAAIYVTDMGSTAISMYQQPTIWVRESPDEVFGMISPKKAPQRCVSCNGPANADFCGFCLEEE